jgi:uncharacterized protein YukE
MGNASQLPTKKRVRVDHWFTPPEAHTIASQFRAKAGEIRAQAQNIRRGRSTLDISWEGNSKNNYFASLSPVPGDLDNYANWLEQKANQIENLKALEYRWEWRDA